MTKTENDIIRENQENGIVSTPMDEWDWLKHLTENPEDNGAVNNPEEAWNWLDKITQPSK